LEAAGFSPTMIRAWLAEAQAGKTSMTAKKAKSFM
jgi:hypothetical protein